MLVRLGSVVTAFLAIPLLGEPITAGLAVALALIVAGVLLFNLPARPTGGAPPRRRQGDGGRAAEPRIIQGKVAVAPSE